MQTASSMIWTRVIESISYNGNQYTTSIYIYDIVKVKIVRCEQIHWTFQKVIWNLK